MMLGRHCIPAAAREEPGPHLDSRGLHVAYDMAAAKLLQDSKRFYANRDMPAGSQVRLLGAGAAN